MNGSASEWKMRARAIISRAVLAPSSHNTQPWLFRISESAIDLYADRTRALPVNDPDDRELAISCGCALMNLRVAAAEGGSGSRVQLHPSAHEPDWLARVSLSPQSGGATAEAGLVEFIECRRTYRRRFAAREVNSAALEQMSEAAKLEGSWLRPILPEDARQQAASLVAEGDAEQWANPSWRGELAAWMHPRRTGDGLSVPALATPVARLVVRTFDLGGGVGAKDRKLAESSPLLAVLGTEDDGEGDWLLAGQALQRVLLVACRNDLQASYLNQPVQVASLRPRLRDLVGGAFPQILLRIGYPVEELSAAPRRAIEDVVQWQA